MISHEIIVVKPTHTYNSSNWTNRGRPNPDIKSQADLDKWREKFGIQVGDYVTYRTQTISGADVAYAVLKVEKIQHNFEQMTIKKYGPYHPELLYLVSLKGMARWDDIQLVRRITENEYINAVKPYLDQLRNHSESPA